VIPFINKQKKSLAIISGCFIGIGWFMSLFGSNTIKDLFLIIATLIGILPILTKAIQALKLRVFSIELLVSIAVIGALMIKEYTESSVVTFLFLFGNYLERRTLEKTRSSIKSLLDLAPREATVNRNGKVKTIPVEDVIVGDRVLVRQGGKIPADGMVVFGKATINEAHITGESLPVFKTIGDFVYSGTILDSGFIEMRAEKVGDDTTFAKMVELIEEAQESKTKAERFLDKFSNIYTPGIMILAIMVFFITMDFHLAITFLVIACPGALVIGAPVSMVVGIGNCAKHGVLIKGGEFVDQLSKVDTMIFDKTGTLTKGRPQIMELDVFGEFNENEMLALVARAEMISEHPIGQTIVKEAETRTINFQCLHMEDGEAIKGMGIKAKVDEKNILAGNRKLMGKEKIHISQSMEKLAVSREKDGRTVIFIAVNSEIQGMISIGDPLRDDVKLALERLRKLGVRKMFMLTGDNYHTAKSVANELGLEFRAEMLPDEKVTFVRQLKSLGYCTAMVGDGVNDAPAIVTSDIGIAMGKGGAEISMESANVVLISDQLMQIPVAISLAKATMRNMKQNIMIALLVSLLLLIGVLDGSVHLATGMFIHELSILLVIGNAIRLLKLKGID